MVKKPRKNKSKKRLFNVMGLSSFALALLVLFFGFGIVINTGLNKYFWIILFIYYLLCFLEEYRINS